MHKNNAGLLVCSPTCSCACKKLSNTVSLVSILKWHIAMLYISVLGILKYSIGWRPQIARFQPRIELQMNSNYFSNTINVDTGLNHENWAKLRELSYKWMLKIIKKNINITKGSKSHKLSPKHILPIEMVKSMGSNRKDIHKECLKNWFIAQFSRHGSIFVILPSVNIGGIWKTFWINL